MRFQWRRGLLLAGIHLAVCAPLIVWEEANRWDWARSQENPQPLELAHAAPGAAKPAGEGETVSFSRCSLWRLIPWQEKIINFDELPAAAFSQWGELCPPSWTLSGLVGMGWPNRDSRRKEVEFSIGLCSLIALQWILVGGLPLVHPRKWFWEPGALITIFTCTGILGLFAPLVWLLWLIALVWRLLQGGYRRALSGWRLFRHTAVGSSIAK